MKKAQRFFPHNLCIESAGEPILRSLFSRKINSLSRLSPWPSLGRRSTPVPEENARVARAAFRKGNLLMRIRDDIGIFYDDQMFACLYDARGQLAISP